MRIASVGRALPGPRHSQETLLAGFRDLWSLHLRNPKRLDQIHRNALVGGRHLALPLEEYRAIDGFRARNDAFLRCAVPLGETAVRDALARAGLEPREIRHFFFASVTGLAVPSIDARLMNRLGLRSDVKRTPIFGLGCVAGAAGIARAADVLKAYPGETAVLLCVELCSLTLQREDLSVPNLIATGLFGDGAAAVVLTGSEVPQAGPRILATRSIFYPGTEDAMGWEVGDTGFRVVLSAEVPRIARGIRKDVDEFLGSQGVAIEDVSHFICHPGGPRVLEAVEQALELPKPALALSWRSLHEIGNLSSASVLMVLRDTLESDPKPGSLGLLMAMGPGFCAELVLLRW
jgi:alkylresorcinol/alkylpyrone synthase